MSAEGTRRQPSAALTGATPVSARGGNPDGAPPALRAAHDADVLRNYRIAVDALHADLHPIDDPDFAERTIGKRLAEPPMSTLLALLPGGVSAVYRALLDELRRFRPNSPSSANDANALVRIFLLSQIDTLWCAELERYDDADAVRGDADLVDLRQLRHSGSLRFRFKFQPRGLPGRIRNRLVRSLFPGRAPHTSGLSLGVARPEAVALLNQIADEFEAATPPGTPSLWVTSILRTVGQQHRLRELGYSAVLPSAHCSGMAMDVEMRWFAGFGADGILAKTLLDYQSRGLVNVIDEGQAWHVCINPARRSELRQGVQPTAEGI